MTARLVQFALRYEAHIEHPVQDDIGARPGIVDVHRWSELRRRLEQAGQHRRLRQVHIADRLAEIILRRRLDPVVAAAQIGTVEIHLENLVLAQPRLDPQGEEGLVDLAPHGALGAEEEVLGQLLGERRSALYDPIRPGIGHHGPEGALDIDAEMAVEARVLCRQHRADHVGRDLGQRYGVVLANPAPADDIAVDVGEGDGVLAAAIPDVIGLMQRRQRKGDQREGEHQAEGQAIVEKVDEDPLHPPDAKALQPRGIARPAVAQRARRLEDARTDQRIEPHEPTEQRMWSLEL